MEKNRITLAQCGGESKEVSLDITTNDFSVEFNGKQYRFEITPDNSLQILMINGVDAQIIADRGYPGVKLSQK